MGQDVEIITTQPRTVAVCCFEGAAEAIPGRIGDAFGRVAAYLAGARLPFSGPAIAYYRRCANGFQVRAGFPVEAPVSGMTVSSFELPGGEVARMEHIGPYTTLPVTYAALERALEERGRKPDESAGSWEEYWSEPTTPPEATRTVVYWPLAPAA
jgi:effector-binding domain-containing protein